MPASRARSTNDRVTYLEQRVEELKAEVGYLYQLYLNAVEERNESVWRAFKREQYWYNVAQLFDETTRADVEEAVSQVGVITRALDGFVSALGETKHGEAPNLERPPEGTIDPLVRPIGGFYEGLDKLRT